MEVKKLVFNEEIVVGAVPPFNFSLGGILFLNGDRQIRRYEDGRYWQVVRVNGKLMLVVAEAKGTIDKPLVAAELKSDKAITLQDKEKAKEVVSSIFNLGFDLNLFYEQVKGDSVMSQVTQKLRGLKSPATLTPFEALVDAVVEQQISMTVAVSIERKIIKKFGDALNLGEVYFAYPTPQRIALATIEELRWCGLSQRKAEYIKNAATLVAEGKIDFEKLKQHENPEDIIRELDAVRGIGVWTAEFILLRGMQRLEALPADDLGLRRLVSKYYCDGESIKSAQVREIAKSWGKWKGLAAYYLVIADMMSIGV